MVSCRFFSEINPIFDDFCLSAAWTLGNRAPPLKIHWSSSIIISHHFLTQLAVLATHWWTSPICRVADRPTWPWPSMMHACRKVFSECSVSSATAMGPVGWVSNPWPMVVSMFKLLRRVGLKKLEGEPPSPMELSSFWPMLNVFLLGIVSHFQGDPNEQSVEETCANAGAW